MRRSSHDIWTELLAKYKGRGSNTKWDVFRKIEEIKLKDFSGIAAYGQQIIKYGEEIELMNLSWDEYAAIKILNGVYEQTRKDTMVNSTVAGRNGGGNRMIEAMAVRKDNEEANRPADEEQRRQPSRCRANRKRKDLTAK